MSAVDFSSNYGPLLIGGLASAMYVMLLKYKRNIHKSKFLVVSRGCSPSSAFCIQRRLSVTQLTLKQ